MVEKCCFVSLSSGSLLVGVVTFIYSMVICLYSAAILLLEHSHPSHGVEHFRLLTNLDLDHKALNATLYAMIVIQVVWMTTSALLMVGVKKCQSSFVLGYFAFGIVITILMILSGLLVLLKSHWILSVIQFISAVLYTNGLIVVFHEYEVMVQEKPGDETHLWNPEENELDITA